MSIRLGTSQDTGWGGTLPAFLKSPSFDDAFVAEVCASLGRQGHWLSRHLSANGNWRSSCARLKSWKALADWRAAWRMILTTS